SLGRRDSHSFPTRRSSDLAVRAALDHCGWGSGASPLITGHGVLHAELERRLAEFEGTEAALLFPTGFAANLGTVASLVGKGDVIDRKSTRLNSSHVKISYA